MINETAFAGQRLDSTFETWNRILNYLRAHAQAAFEGARLQAAETLLSQGRISIAAGELNAHMHQSVFNDHHHETLDRIGKQLSAIIDLDTLIETMAQEFPQLGIPSCYFSLHSEPLHPEAGPIRSSAARADVYPGG